MPVLECIISMGKCDRTSAVYYHTNQLFRGTFFIIFVLNNFIMGVAAIPGRCGSCLSSGYRTQLQDKAFCSSIILYSLDYSFNFVLA